MARKFLISVLTLNRLEATKACLKAVFENSNDFDLVVTDNNSTDDTVEWLKEFAKDKPNVTLNFNSENLGFIPPNNAAFDLAYKNGNTYFIALNNDTVPPLGWLNHLERGFRNVKVVVVGPSNGCFSLHDNFDGHGGTRREYVEGSCLCVRVDIIKKHWNTLFSDYLYFIYGDDSDLSLRLREKGYEIFHAPFEVPHSRGETVQTQPEVKAKCNAAQQANHKVLLKRWAYYLRFRVFNPSILIKRHFAIGDALLVTPIIEALKELNPNFKIYVETDFPQVFSNNPHVVAAGKALSITNPVIELDLNDAYENMTKTHIIKAYELKTREIFYGLPEVKLKLTFPTSPSSKNWAGTFRNQLSPKVLVVHAGPHHWVGKHWSLQKWEQLCTYFVEAGWHVVAVGAHKLPEEIKHAKDMTNQLNLDRLAALIAESNLFIGLDSAPMHIAQSQGTPTVGLFGVTTPRYIMTESSPHTYVTADQNLPGAGKRHLVKGEVFVDCGPEVMDSIQVDQVIAAARRLVTI